MARLIDADKLKKHYAWWQGGTLAKTLDEMKRDFDTIIDLQPTVEAEPNNSIETVDWYHQNADGKMVLGANSNQQAWFKVDDVFKELKAEPIKHGHWITVSDGYGNGVATASICECSLCKDTIWVYKNDERKWKYCPNCGARMDGGENG